MRDVRMTALLAMLAGSMPELVLREIAPPPKYRDNTCPESSMRPSEPMPVRDAEVLSAADAKRARKAAKRLKDAQR